VFKRLVKRKPHGLLRRAYVVRRHARLGRLADARRRRAAPLRVRRRAAPEGHRRALRRALRLRRARRHRIDGDAAHLPVEPAGEVRYGTTGTPVPDTTSSCAARTDVTWPTARSATSYIRGRAPRSCTGRMRRNLARPSRARGRGAATNTFEARTAATRTPGAATTC
jgi:hypothetical protein